MALTIDNCLEHISEALNLKEEPILPCLDLMLSETFHV